MRGRTHLTLGVLTGLGAAALLPHVPLTITGLAVAGLSSLATDLDEPRGMLGQRIAVSPWRIRSALGSLGLALVGYSYLSLKGAEQLVLTGLGLFLLMIGLFLKESNARRIALMLTGLGLFAAGVFLGYVWLDTLGLFVGVSPLFKHRTWCHSLVGAFLWTAIWYKAAADLHMDSAAWYAAAGYLSHLASDSFTKNGVMWFYPWKRAWKLPLIATGSKRGNWLEWAFCLAYGMGIAALYGIHMTWI
jgi:inner membrane protein